MKRSIISSIFVILSIFVLHAEVVGGDDAGPNVSWSLNTESGIMTISGSGDMKDFNSILPPWSSYRSIITFVDVFPGVTHIGDRAFADCNNLYTVQLREGVTSIGKRAFANCTNLNCVYYNNYNAFNVAIPNSVTSIGDNAFQNCTGIRSVTLSENMTAIAQSTFYGCSELTSVEIPFGINSIGTGAFSYCTKLSSVPLPNSIHSIGESAFYNCTALTSVTIPAWVTYIGTNAYQMCTGLTAVHIADLEAWCAINFGSVYANPLSYAHNLYLNGALVTDLVIPNGTTSIKNYTFAGGGCFTSISIPNTVTGIGNCALYGCNGLTSIDIPNGVNTIGVGAFEGCSGLDSIDIPSGVTSVNDYTFSGCSGMSSVTIPNTVTSIGASAFKDCSNLDEVSIPAGVTTIGANAFKGCSDLHLLTIPSSVTTIGANAFDGCSGLSTINIPAGVTSIGDKAFDNCDQLRQFTVEDENTHYSSCDGVLYNADGSQILQIPKAKLVLSAPLTTHAGLKVLPTGTFNNANITKLYLPGVELIEKDAVTYCSLLEEVHFSAALDSIVPRSFNRNRTKRFFFDTPNTKYASVDGVLYSGDTTVLIKYPELYSVVGAGSSILPLHDSLRYIPPYACMNVNTSGNCRINLPAHLDSIGEFAFENTNANNNYWQFYASNNHIPVLHPNAFQIGGPGVNKMGLHVPYLSYKEWKAAPIWGQMNLEWIIEQVLSGSCGENVEWTYTLSNRDLSFSGSGDMYKYDAQEDVPWEMLSEAYGIASTSLPTTVTSICDYAYVGNTNLTACPLHEGLTEIGDHAFDGCTNLTITSIPSTLKRLGDYALRGCYITAWDVSGSLNLPSGLTYIGAANFAGCYATLVDIPASVKHVGDSAFAACSSLGYIRMHTGLEHIGNYAFADSPGSMSSDGTMGIPATVKYIGDDAFAIHGVLSPNKYLHPTFPDSIEYIGKRAFIGRNILTTWTNTSTITLPATLTYVGDSAFRQCYSANSVRIKAATPPTITAQTFNPNVTKTYVPVGSLATYKSAPVWQNMNCHVADFELYESSSTWGGAVPVTLKNNGNNDIVDHLAAEGFQVKMSEDMSSPTGLSNTNGYIVGLTPETSYNFTVYVVTTGGDYEPLSYAATTGTAFSEGYEVNYHHMDSLFRFEISCYMGKEMTDNIGFQITTEGYNHDTKEPYGESIIINGLVKWTSAYMTDFVGDHVVIPVERFDRMVYECHVRAFFYDAAADTTYYSDWEYVSVRVGDESDWRQVEYLAPMVEAYKLSVGSTKATFLCEVTVPGSAPITSYTVHCVIYGSDDTNEEFEQTIPSDGSDHQSFTITGLEPNTTYDYVWIEVNMEGHNNAYTIQSDGHGQMLSFTTAPALTYTVTFLNWDSTELQVLENVVYGTIPSYTGATPLRPENNEFTYTFSGWTPEIVPAVADATYKATYTATPKPQGIENISTQSSNDKFVKDGRLYIRRGENVYDAQGVRAK